MSEPTLGTPTDSITLEIVNAVADETGRDPNALPSLYDAVDPDALSALLTRGPTVARGSDDVTVTFEYADCTVTVSSTEGIAVSTEGARPEGEAPVPTVDD